MKIIENGTVYNKDGFRNETIFIREDRIVSREEFLNEKEKSNEKIEIIDATEKYVLPGLVDLHFHGCAGYDFCDGNTNAITKIAEYELSNGITTIIPATMTLSKEELINILSSAAEFKKLQDEEWKENSFKAAAKALLAGVHMEGPYISAKKKGAQREDCIQIPDAECFSEYQKASGNLVKLISVAPEVENAIRFIKEVSGNTAVSLAHTTADYDTAVKAFNAGANHVTHTYNAMPPYNHREPGVIGAGFDCGAYMEIISDGIHIHPSVIRGTCAMIGKEKMILISDSMMGTGLEDGIYQLGGQRVTKKGSLAVLDDNTIAGSVTNLYSCMKKAVEFGIELKDAVRFASENPAASLKMDKDFGSLNEGVYADIILADKKLDIEHIIHHGVKVR